MPTSDGTFTKAEIAHLFGVKSISAVSNWQRLQDDGTRLLPLAPNEQDLIAFAKTRGKRGQRGGNKTYHVVDLTKDQFELLQVICEENGMQAVDPTVIARARNEAAMDEAGAGLVASGLDVNALRQQIKS